MQQPRLTRRSFKQTEAAPNKSEVGLNLGGLTHCFVDIILGWCEICIMLPADSIFKQSNKRRKNYVFFELVKNNQKNCQDHRRRPLHLESSHGGNVDKSRLFRVRR